MLHELTDVTSTNSTNESNNQNLLSSISGYINPITTTLSSVFTSTVTSITHAVNNAFDLTNSNGDPFTEPPRERSRSLPTETVIITQPLPVLNDRVKLALFHPLIIIARISVTLIAL